MTLHHGDCLDVMARMEPESVDAVVTDPPAGIGFMGKTWDHHKGGRAQWVGWMTDVMRECYRVLKPGHWLICWAIPRRQHWTMWAIEDAGFLVTDVIMHCFASGFPKGKAQLKPAYEPWVLARKPGPLRMLAIDECRIPTSADDAVAMERANTPGSGRFHASTGTSYGRPTPSGPLDTTLGRWPANIVLTDPIFDGGIEGVVGGGESASGGNINGRPVTGYSKGWADERWFDGYSDTGTYSRYFLIPKADRADREPVLGGLPDGFAPTMGNGIGGREHDPADRRAYRQNVHPTVKPTELMRHLVRLVTPAGGTVLDPFGGSGTTALAAEMEGFPWILIEKELEYVEICRARLNGVQKGLGLSA